VNYLEMNGDQLRILHGGQGDNNNVFAGVCHGDQEVLNLLLNHPSWSPNSFHPPYWYFHFYNPSSLMGTTALPLPPSPPAFASPFEDEEEDEEVVFGGGAPFLSPVAAAASTHPTAPFSSSGLPPVSAAAAAVTRSFMSLGKSQHPASLGLSLLHYACLFGQVKLARYLLKMGIDPNLRTANYDHHTPLHLAAFKSFFAARRFGSCSLAHLPSFSSLSRKASNGEVAPRKRSGFKGEGQLEGSDPTSRRCCRRR